MYDTGHLIELPSSVVLRASGVDPRTQLLWYDFEKVGGSEIRIHVLDTTSKTWQDIATFLATWAEL